MEHIKILEEGYGMVEDINYALFLRSQKLYLHAIGTLGHASSSSKILGPPFILSKEQLQYLFETGVCEYNPGIDSAKYRIFRALTSKGYFLKEGIKFGCMFVMYSDDPLITHSRSLVTDHPLSPQRLIELCRISHNSQKTLVVAHAEDEAVSFKEVSWVHSSPREKPLQRPPK